MLRSNLTLPPFISVNRTYALCMTRSCIIGCILLLLLPGCLWMGDAGPGTRSVSVAFPRNEGDRALDLSVAEVDAQNALALIDGVLVGNGWIRDPAPPVRDKEGPVATYAKYDTDGLRFMGGPRVFVSGDALRVVIVEAGPSDGYVSSATKRLCSDIRRELVRYYGSKNVKIGHRSNRAL
jgi:hypothetical protein